MVHTTQETGIGQESEQTVSCHAPFQYEAYVGESCGFYLKKAASSSRQLEGSQPGGILAGSGSNSILSCFFATNAAVARLSMRLASGSLALIAKKTILPNTAWLHRT